MFFGLDFFGDTDSFLDIPTDIEDITEITLEGAIFDDLYITSNPDKDMTVKNWDYNTILYALFNGNLLAGNVNFSGIDVTGVRIRRRETGTYDWMTIYDKEIDSIEDINVSYFDKYAKNNTTYDYAVIPMLNGTEGEMNTATIKSEFEGVFIMDKDYTFHCLLDATEGDIKRNTETTFITTLGRKYPIAVSNGNASYDSSTFSGLFMPLDYDTGDFNFDGALEYRINLKNFLGNKTPKLLKYEDGRMWIVNTAETNETPTPYIDVDTKTTFTWTETGDANNELDLYNNNLIDINPEWLVI